MSASEKIAEHYGRCVICHDNDATYRYTECGHLSFCGTCQHVPILKYKSIVCVLCNHRSKPEQSVDLGAQKQVFARVKEVLLNMDSSDVVCTFFSRLFVAIATDQIVNHVLTPGLHGWFKHQQKQSFCHRRWSDGLLMHVSSSIHHLYMTAMSSVSATSRLHLQTCADLHVACSNMNLYDDRTRNENSVRPSVSSDLDPVVESHAAMLCYVSTIVENVNLGVAMVMIFFLLYSMVSKPTSGVCRKSASGECSDLCRQGSHDFCPTDVNAVSDRSSIDNLWNMVAYVQPVGETGIDVSDNSPRTSMDPRSPIRFKSMPVDTGKSCIGGVCTVDVADIIIVLTALLSCGNRNVLLLGSLIDVLSSGIRTETTVSNKKAELESPYNV